MVAAELVAVGLAGAGWAGGRVLGAGGVLGHRGAFCAGRRPVSSASCLAAAWGLVGRGMVAMGVWHRRVWPLVQMVMPQITDRTPSVRLAVA